MQFSQFLTYFAYHILMICFCHLVNTYPLNDSINHICFSTKYSAPFVYHILVLCSCHLVNTYPLNGSINHICFISQIIYTPPRFNESFYIIDVNSTRSYRTFRQMSLDPIQSEFKTWTSQTIFMKPASNGCSDCVNQCCISWSSATDNGPEKGQCSDATVICFD